MTFMPAEVTVYEDKTTAPTVNEDQNDGYEVGDLWIDETNDTYYVCVDITAGAAVWIPVTVSHTHDDRYYTETELNAGQLDDRYFTETEINAGFQPLDSDLTSLALLGTAADKIAYTTNAHTWAEAAITAFALSILDDVDEATFKGTVNLEIGIDVLAQQAIGIADDNLVEVDGPGVGVPADDEYARWTANGLEGRTTAEVLSDIGGAASSHTHDDRYYTETEIGTWRNSVTQTEMGYLDGITSDIQTQLDARCLESVLGTSIGTGLLLDVAVLKASSVLQTYHTINPSADVQSVLGCANEAAIRTFLDLEAGVDFPSLTTFNSHKNRHDPVDGDDPLDTANAAEISVVVAAGTGSSHSFARADHVHAIVHGITDNHIVTVDGTANQNEHAVFGVGGIAGLTDAELLAALSGDAGAAFSWNSQNLTSVGTIGCGTITTTGDYLLANGNYVGISGAERLEFYSAGYAIFQGCRVGLGVTPDATVDITLQDRTFGVNILGQDPDIDANSANYKLAETIYINKLDIASGVTDSGYRIGLRIGAHINDADFLGTLATRYGMHIQHGHYTGAGAGTVTTEMGLRLEGLSSGASTITNWFGLYQSGAPKNYFSGSIGIGTSPNQKLTVEGTMSLKEQAAANADTAAYGQLWVKSDAPNSLWFTNDNGTDYVVVPKGTVTITTSSDAVDVTGWKVIMVSTTDGNIVIGGFANGVGGQVIHVVKETSANTLTIENNEATGTQKILTSDGTDKVFTTYGGMTLMFAGAYWHEVSGSPN